jgi:hypothetical protein
VSAAAYGSRRLLRRPATGGVTVDLSDLLIAYANAVVSRATPGDKSARGLFDDDDSVHRQRKGVQRRLPEKLIETMPVRDLLLFLG